MKNIKEIYNFQVLRKVQKEVTEEGKDNTKIIKTVEENEPVKIIFKNPSRQEREEADLVYAVEYGRCVRAGVLTAPLVEKLYDEKEKSGILSDNFASKYLSLYEKFFEIQNEFTKLELKEEKTKEEENRVKDIAVEFARIRNELQTLESSRNNLFQNTAETKAQNKTILWLTLFLTYKQEQDRSAEPFFEGKTFDDKLNYYDQMIEKNDDFVNRVIDKIAFFVSLWYLRRASTKEDFDEIERRLNESPPAENSEAEQTEAETKPEEAKAEEPKPEAEAETEESFE